MKLKRRRLRLQRADGSDDERARDRRPLRWLRPLVRGDFATLRLARRQVGANKAKEEEDKHDDSGRDDSRGPTATSSGAPGDLGAPARSALGCQLRLRQTLAVGEPTWAKRGKRGGEGGELPSCSRRFQKRKPLSADC